MQSRQSQDINAIRQVSLTEAFKKGKNERAFILIPQYPFMIIGIIETVVSDYVIIETETTNINELDGRKMIVHIDQIEVFYIEGDHGAKIPRLDC